MANTRVGANGSAGSSLLVRRVAYALAAATLVAGLVWLSLFAYRGWRAARSLLHDLDEIEALASSPIDELDPLEAIDLLRRTRLDVERVQAAARPVLWLPPYLGWVPRYGADIQAAPDLLLIAGELARAGDDLATTLLTTVANASDSSGAGSDLVPEVLGALTESQAQVIAARKAVRAATEARARLEPARLSPRLRGWVAKLDRYLPLVDHGVGAVLLLPQLVGVDGPRTYIVLVQNEDELRATGGFISAVAEVTLEGGKITAMQLEDSYAVDDFSQPYPEPPAPLREYMLADLWVFRDSNWSPDFPTAARAALSLYGISRDTRVDGVIALDQHTIRVLVEALAPLSVGGTDTPVTGDNVIDLARRAWSPGEGGASYEWWAQRKQFMADVLAAARARVEGGLDQRTAIRLARAGWKSLREKHLLISVSNDEAGAVLAELGWDGGVWPGPGDFLMVVDTNMGFNKVNALVEQEIEHVVDLRDPSHPRATLIVRHRHPGKGEGECWHQSRYDPTYEQMMQRCYWNYLRVLVPEGTQLAEATPHVVDGRYLISGQSSPAEVAIEPPVSGRCVLATFLLVPTGEETETVFDLILPPAVVRAREEGGYEYVLTVQKQPGTRGNPLRIAVALPPGASLTESTPPPARQDGVTVAYDLRLWTDQTVRLRFQ